MHMCGLPDVLRVQEHDLLRRNSRTCVGCQDDQGAGRNRNRPSQFTHMCGLPEVNADTIQLNARRNSRTCVGCPVSELKGAFVN